jgi:hypothetical protein
MSRDYKSMGHEKCKKNKKAYNKAREIFGKANESSYFTLGVLYWMKSWHRS